MGAVRTRPLAQQENHTRHPGCYASCEMSPEMRIAIQRMSRDEQLELLDEVWSLVRDDALPLPAPHAAELRRRVAAADADGVIGEPWAQLRDRLRSGT